MKRRIEIHNRDRYISKNHKKPESDFYARWYEKFGDVPNRSMSIDEFKQVMKEMKEFE